MNHIVFGKNGGLTVFCKMCGVKIAGMELRPKGSGPDINVMVSKFIRYPNYAEAKLQCSDGSFHVTHGCKSCLTVSLTKQELFQLYKADMREMNMPIKRKPVSVVIIDHTAQGIV